LSRDDQIKAFLAQIGWAKAERGSLAGDASFRRYERLRLGDKRAVLMDAPPGREDVRPFVAIGRHLSSLGYSAPTIYEADTGNGFLLIEDLGDGTFARLMAAGTSMSELYPLGVDVLSDLHRRPESEAVPAGLKPYDGETILREALLFTEWYLPSSLGAEAARAAEESFAAAWRKVASLMDGQPRTLMMRDYFADNLMRLEGRSGLKACGLLDFQDAVAGPPAYDVVSLLEDARRDLPADLVASMLDRYRAPLTPKQREAFDLAYAVLGAQRHVRVLGVFTRLCKRDGKPGYLVHIPRLWRLLERSLRHPALAPVKDWFDRAVPAARRITPDPASLRP
jgi:aminoglycoside/choline kinase family phosphotransferase